MFSRSYRCYVKQVTSHNATNLVIQGHSAINNNTSVPTVKDGIENNSNNVIKANPAPVPQDEAVNMKNPDTDGIKKTKARRVFTDDPSQVSKEQERLGKDREAKELLRQLAIDERDDFVMDTIPLARNSNGSPIMTCIIIVRNQMTLKK
jgi:hypothetical protein